MTRRENIRSRGPVLWTAFCLVLCSLGLLGNAGAATLTVNTTADSSDAAGSCGTGTCSLRDAITQAAAGDVIQFASTVTPTITLLSPLPAIAANMTIAGPGANMLTVSGNNSATVGTIFTINTGVTASISGLTIANGNSNSSDQGGGGILNDGMLTVSNCTISGNSGIGSVNNEGGGITNYGTLTVSSSTVSGNSAASGGGIFNGDGNTLTVTNSTFSANSASGKGGGIFNLTDGTLTVTNSTISGNSGGEGGGIETNNATTITNSIVAGNTATAADDIDGTYSPASGGGNVITPASPIALAPLANYGGPTQTFLPLPNSPAICAGTANALTTDQRGVIITTTAHCASGAIDSGAVQSYYNSIQFTNTNAGITSPNASIGGYAAYVGNSASLFQAAPIVSVTENMQNNVGGVPITLTLDGMGTLSGSAATTVAETGATFSSLSVSDAGYDTLNTNLTVGTKNLPASANLQIVSITLSPTTLPNPTLQASYNQTITASGGSTSGSTPVYTFSYTGSLPTGIQLGATGLLHGTPTATGSFTFIVKATDGNGFFGSQSYTVKISLPVSATTTQPTITWTVGQGMVSSTPVTVTPNTGTSPYAYSISPPASTLVPAGLAWDSTTGTLSGSPTAPLGPATYSVTVSDANGSQASPQKFSLTVNSSVTTTLKIPTEMLTIGQANTSFTPVIGSGGTGTLTYSLTPAASSLPSGLTFDNTTGSISGAPKSTDTPSTTAYTVKVTDQNNVSDSESFTLIVNATVTATLKIPTEALTINQPVTSFTPVSGSGGTGMLTYSLSPTTLPSGLGFDSASGTISGSPELTDSPSTTTYTVKVTDQNNVFDSKNFTLVVNAAVTATQKIATETLTIGQPSISFTPVTASPGTGTLSYSISPSLPNGLKFDTGSGMISGSPATTDIPSTTTYTVTATDVNKATASQSFTLVVNAAVTATQRIPTEMLTIGQPPRSFTPVTASGGTGALTYSLSPTTLPSGLSFDPTSGTISGSPLAADSTSTTLYTVTVTDQNRATASQNFTLVVNPAVTAQQKIATTTLTVGQAASANFTPVVGGGGTPPLSYINISPSLPQGLALNRSTGAITGVPMAASPSTSYTVTVADTNQATATATFLLTVQNFSLAPSTNSITITHGFTNSSDPVSPESITVTATSIFGFATPSGSPLSVTCTFLAPANATPPTCQTPINLAISSPAGGQTPPIIIDATNATPGAYSLVVSGLDPTTGAIRSTTTVTVYVSFVAPAPMPIQSGSNALTTTTVSFTLPAGVEIPINCNSAVILPSNKIVSTESIPIICTVSPTSIGSSSSTTVQNVSVTVQINTVIQTSQAAAKTDAFLAGLLGVPILAFIGFLSRRKNPQRSFFRFLCGIFAIVLILQSVGCGGSFHSTGIKGPAQVGESTPVGSYYLLVQGPGTGNTKQLYQAVIPVTVIRGQ